MKRLSILIMVTGILAFGCQGEPDRETLEGKIEKNRQRMIQLKQKNKVLQKKLALLRKGNGRTAIPVKTEKISLQTFVHTFQANGSVEAIQEAFISPEISGRIDEIRVVEGQEVNRGDMLVILNSDVLEHSIGEARTQLELARTLFQKRKELWDQQIGSEVEFLTAKNNMKALEKRLQSLKSQLDLTRVRAPISGLVDRIEKRRGELATPGQMLILLVNLDKVYIHADVSENYLADVQRGDPVKVRFPAFSGMEREVQVERAGKTIHPENRTFEIRLVMDNPGEILKPNLIAVLEIRDYFDESALVVPSIVLKKDLKGSYLYTVNRKSGMTEARKIYVTPGMSARNRTVIREGLSPGDEVIVEGYNLLRDGSRINLQ